MGWGLCGWFGGVAGFGCGSVDIGVRAWSVPRKKRGYPSCGSLQLGAGFVVFGFGSGPAVCWSPPGFWVMVGVLFWCRVCLWA